MEMILTPRHLGLSGFPNGASLKFSSHVLLRRKADSWRVPATVLADAARLYMSNKVLHRQNDPFLKTSGNVGVL
jgi:hypothetical protein